MRSFQPVFLFQRFLIASSPIFFSLLILSSLSFIETSFAESSIAEKSASEEIKWEVISDRDGVLTSRQTNHQGPLPAFKGVTEFTATRFDVFALMQDIPKNVSWMHKCKESKKIRQTGDWAAILHNRTEAPWPVSDRDVVINTQVQMQNTKRRIVIDIQSVEEASMPKIDGVVRMPNLKGHYVLTDIEDKKVRVEFLIEADPGGWLPNWVIRLASKSIPFHTLKNLREQVLLHKQRRTYSDYISQLEK